MSKELRAYILKQGLIAAGVNAILNPTLSWLGNLKMAFVPLKTMAIDTAVTCVLLSLLVALFITMGVRRVGDEEVGPALHQPGGGPPATALLIAVGDYLVTDFTMSTFQTPFSLTRRMLVV
jgi:hypothetical protein